jgi:hypothetical protein
MPSNAVTEIAGLEPTHSAREAAALLGRSYSWLDPRVRRGEFVRCDGSTVRPLRTPGGLSALHPGDAQGRLPE